MEAKDILDEILAKERLLDPYPSADRERRVAELSFKAGTREERERLLNYLKGLLESTPKASLASTIDLIETTRGGYDE